MNVQSVTDAATTARASAPKKPRASFEGALAHAASKSAANTPDSVLDSKRVPKGETTKAVKGHAYADVLTGPRNGMYINTSGNKRDGQAFVLVKRDGKEFHIYGSGKDRVVVCLKRKDDDPQPSGTTGAASQ